MSAELAPGERAPPFRLPDASGRTISLSDFKGRKLVLYFYPRANTPGCTREAQAFSALKGAFNRAGTEILGVSADPIKAQAAFRQKHRLSIALASDETRKMLTSYGVWTKKSLYGRDFMGIAGDLFEKFMTGGADSTEET